MYGDIFLGVSNGCLLCGIPAVEIDMSLCATCLGRTISGVMVEVTTERMTVGISLCERFLATPFGYVGSKSTEGR